MTGLLEIMQKLTGAQQDELMKLIKDIEPAAKPTVCTKSSESRSRSGKKDTEADTVADIVESLLGRNPTRLKNLVEAINTKKEGGFSFITACTKGRNEETINAFASALNVDLQHTKTWKDKVERIREAFGKWLAHDDEIRESFVHALERRISVVNTDKKSPANPAKKKDANPAKEKAGGARPTKKDDSCQRQEEDTFRRQEEDTFRRQEDARQRHDDEFQKLLDKAERINAELSCESGQRIVVLMM